MSASSRPRSTACSRCADWLEALGVKQVAMEATGVYWKPCWAILEDRSELMLVNARHVKQCDGPLARDSTEVIGKALFAHAHSLGHVGSRYGSGGRQGRFVGGCARSPPSPGRSARAPDAGHTRPTPPASWIGPVPPAGGRGRCGRARPDGARLSAASRMSASPSDLAVSLTGLLYGPHATRPDSERPPRASGSHRSRWQCSLTAPPAGRDQRSCRAITARAKRSQRATYTHAALTRPPSLQAVPRAATPLVVRSFASPITTFDGAVITTKRVRQ